MEAISASLQNPNLIPKISHSSGPLSATTVEIPKPAFVSVEKVPAKSPTKRSSVSDNGGDETDLPTTTKTKRRKWLEDNSETTTNGFFLFDTSIIQWWAWMKQYHHKNINSSINGRAAVIGFFMAYTFVPVEKGFKDVVQEIESEVSCKLEEGKPGMPLDKRFITSLLSLYLLCFQFSPEG
ncbi:hypothetical protein IGI04_013460 [Brassica rapa subsp. trilocularis]|uniref:Uncharacterized protein n=1 Tax=Brassica rapa subsp. trilocularis TaxID=1813537 RepID=A0ABQ7N8W2_BRACM|nr:hypothetical protein IGI04_013460 [Brassica rapa subsp. trilocularis]